MVPSNQMAEFVCACFAILDYADKFFARHNQSTPLQSLLKEFWKLIIQNIFLLVNIEKGLQFAAKIVVNIFYNKLKIASDEVQKQTKIFFKKAKVKRELVYREIVVKFFLQVFVLYCYKIFR